MRLYLAQHGEALPKDVDPERPLSTSGRQEVERLAALLRRHGLRVARVLHSGKTRTAQTAAILAAAIPNVRVAELQGLAPTDDPAIVGALVAEWDEDAIVVAHLPQLSRLVSLLVTGSESPPVVRYSRPGTLVCLERAADTGAWSVTWVLPPDVLAAEAQGSAG